MLFGNTPPQRPKGLFGMFAPGQGQIPMPQQPMMPPVENDQVQRMQAMMGANRADQLQSTMDNNMGEKKPGINWLGVLADGLAGAAGQTPMYTQHLMQQKAMQQRQQMMQQQREDDWQDFQRQFDYKAKHDTPEPDAFERALLGAGYKPGTQQWAQMYAQRATTLANPIQFVSDGMGGVRPVQTFGGGAAEAPVGNFGPVVDQLPGGVGGNTGGGFPVTGSKLDSVTARNESGNRDYYSNGAAVVSPKGARFAMQVLPSTAQDPGFGLRPANPNDPADMNRLGREYRAKMQSRYKGNLPLMWAAYNAGPGRIDNLLAKYGQNWLQYAPRETQDYVARNMRAVRGN